MFAACGGRTLAVTPVLYRACKLRLCAGLARLRGARARVGVGYACCGALLACLLGGYTS